MEVGNGRFAGQPSMDPAVPSFTDLSGMVPGLVPSSMSAGGETHSNELAQPLPGSQPISAPAPGTGQAAETLPKPDLPGRKNYAHTVSPS